MASIVERSMSGDRIARTIRLVRRRWRLRHALMGLGLVAGLTIVALWIAALAMERAGFSEASITSARLAVGLVVALVALRWVAWPLLRRTTDQRVALYAEEHLPTLDGALMSAVEATGPAAPEEFRKSGLTSGLVQDVMKRLSPHRNGAAVEDESLKRAGIVLFAMLTFGALIRAFGPSYLRHGARLIATPWRKAAEVAPYAISVTPGNAVVAKGADVQIAAQLRGFNSELVEVVTRRGASAEWERIPMGAAGDSIRFSARLFDLATDLEYYVESSGVRSGVFKLNVRNLPAVRRVDLDLRFPAYTGLPPEHVDDNGDIAALRGTRVKVSVRSTMPVRGGRLVFEGDSGVALTRANDSTLVGELLVRDDGFYRIELTAEDGTRVAGSLEYVIDALEDQPPSVHIKKPGRDTRPTNVEEVFIEVEAADDYGVGKVELAYTVNGGEEKSVVINSGEGTRSKEVVGGHTLFLEEMGLKPGDVVSYYAKARDGGAAGTGKEASTDIYFMTIRPFGKDYRQNQQGGGGGGGSGENPGALTQQQREIVSATFKTERDKESTPPTTFRENVTTIQLGEGRLRDQVEQLAERMNRPVVLQSDTSFKIIVGLLQKASGEMKSAEELLGARDTKGALTPEQKALQALEQAEAVYRDVQVSQGGGGGGGGGGAQQDAEDLADLFELETDKLRNQYEQVRRGEQQQANQQVDEAVERLKQLAARQQQENERARQRAQQMGQQGGSSGGGGQRQLADEAEQLARQLERLAREQKSDEMAESARRLQEAADQMRRSATAQGQSGSRNGSGSAASDQIENARRLLEEARNNGQTKNVADAAQRAAELARQQREVAKDVAGLPEAGASRPEREQRLDQRKEQMASDVQQLQDDLNQMARDTRRERPETARQLDNAAARMRDGRLRDKIQYSRDVMRRGSPDYAKNFEEGITQDLDSLSTRLASAAGAAGKDGQRSADRTLDQARDLVRGLSSLDERMRNQESGENQGQQGQQGRDGRQGQQGQGNEQGQQPGQRGLQSQNQQGQGQQGQGQGQQGQGQQGQGQQGQGQQGQGQQGQGQQGQGQQGQGQQGQGQQQGQQGQGQQGQGQRGQQGQGQGAQQGQGQGAQQGQGQGGGGQTGGSPRGLNPSSPGGGGGGAATTPYTGEDVRQYTREMRNQRDAAEQLREQLRQQGQDTRDLDELINQLKAMESTRVFNDPEELAKLRGSVVEGFKEFEFALRRQLAGANDDKPALGSGDLVPARYRDMVNEYFKSLSKKPATTPPPKPKP